MNIRFLSTRAHGLIGSLAIAAALIGGAELLLALITRTEPSDCEAGQPIQRQPALERLQ